MAAITAADVNKLRQMTGAGMMDSKKALVEADGDFEKAIELLRKAGQKVAAKRADNTTSEGVVLVEVASDGKNGKLVALACETEPVSKVEAFRTLAGQLMEAALAKSPATKEELLALALPGGQTAQETITELIGKIGEKIVVTDYVSMDAEQVVSYLHSTGKLGVLVAFENTGGTDVETVGKDIAMQIAAMKPVAIDKSGVDATTVEKELEIGREQARAEGKPENILDRIAQGRLEKFYKESTLLAQEFVKDNSMTIAQVLEKTQKGLTVKDFKRISLT